MLRAGHGEKTNSALTAPLNARYNNIRLHSVMCIYTFIRPRE